MPLIIWKSRKECSNLLIDEPLLNYGLAYL